MSEPEQPIIESPVTPPPVAEPPVEERSSTQTHLQILQGVITRMAGNSANCKTWCITLLAGLVTVAFGPTGDSALAVGGAVTLLFYFLDSYYLALEKGFRDQYDAAVKEIHAKTPISALFQVTVKTRWRWALKSRSTLPMYLVLLAALGGAYLLMKL